MIKKIELNQLKLSKQRGALLVEVMLTAALFSIVSITIASLLLLSSVMSRTNDAHARLNDNAMKILHFVGRELKETSAANRLVITDNGASDTIRFQIPVDWDNDGDVTVTPIDTEIEWGTYDQAGQSQVNNPGVLGRWARYSIVNNQLVRDVLTNGGDVIDNLRTIVGNNVQAFDVALNGNRAIITVNLRETDAVGQAGTARNLNTSFSYSVYLRNAAN